MKFACADKMVVITSKVKLRDGSQTAPKWMRFVLECLLAQVRIMVFKYMDIQYLFTVKWAKWLCDQLCSLDIRKMTWFILSLQIKSRVSNFWTVSYFNKTSTDIEL